MKNDRNSNIRTDFIAFNRDNGFRDTYPSQIIQGRSDVYFSLPGTNCRYGNLFFDSLLDIQSYYSLRFLCLIQIQRFTIYDLKFPSFKGNTDNEDGGDTGADS